MFENGIESTKFTKVLYKVNEMWKHLQDDWSQILDKRTNVEPTKKVYFTILLLL
jgi:hypothetical protein